MVKRSWNVSLFPTRPPMLIVNPLPSVQSGPTEHGYREGRRERRITGRKKGKRQQGRGEEEIDDNTEG